MPPAITDSRSGSAEPITGRLSSQYQGRVMPCWIPLISGWAPSDSSANAAVARAVARTASCRQNASAARVSSPISGQPR